MKVIIRFECGCVFEHENAERDPYHASVSIHNDCRNAVNKEHMRVGYSIETLLRKMGITKVETEYGLEHLFD